MKKSSLLVSAGIIAILLFSLSIATMGHTSGSPDGNTGSPGDGKTCAHVGCHTGTATFRSDIITTNVPPEGYMADATYTITITATESGRSKFGFEAAPQDLDGNTLGTMIVTNSTITKLTGFGKYITHTTSGTSGSGSKVWTFNWTPGTTHGDVTFYSAINCANGDGHASGDLIFFSSTLIPENPLNTTAISSVEMNEGILMNNPVSNALHIQFQKAKSYDVSIYNLNGKNVLHTAVSNSSADIDMKELPAGAYIVRIEQGEASSSRRILKL